MGLGLRVLSFRDFKVMQEGVLEFGGLGPEGIGLQNVVGGLTMPGFNAGLGQENMATVLGVRWLCCCSFPRFQVRKGDQ